jgi:predicted Zn-dependent protease
MLPIEKSILTAITCLALAVPGAPARSQPVGLPSMGADSADVLSPATERQLGEAIMAQGRHDPDYLDDPELRQYLTSMARRLSAHAPGPVPQLEVFPVLAPEINAFAMPGGFIGVNTGLLVSAQSESELAAVLGHEISHVVQRHIARGMTQQNQSGAIALASMAAALLAAVAGSGNLAMGVAAFGQAAAIDRQLGFSRDAEREADRVGLQMLYKAGYDPSGMATMFGRLESASRLNEGRGGGAWASTHPLSLERMSDVQNRIRDLGPVNHQDSVDFWFLRAKAQVAQARDSNSLRTAQQQLQDQAATQSGVRRAAAQYGLARYWLQRNDPKQAQSYWEQATAGVPQGVPQLAKLGIDIALARKDSASAMQQAQDAAKRWPDRRALGLAYATALLDAGRIDEAQVYLRDRIKVWGAEEPNLYQMLAFSEDRNGRLVAARRDMARFYELTGAYAAAESQLQQARTLSGDFYEQSQIDVGIREIQRKLADERELLERFKS